MEERLPEYCLELMRAINLLWRERLEKEEEWDF